MKGESTMSDKNDFHGVDARTGRGGPRSSEEVQCGKQVTADGMTYVIFDMAEARADLVRRIDHSGVKPRTD